MAEDQMAWRKSFSDVSACPWMPLTIDEKQFWMKSHFVTDCVSLYVFDGIDIWSETSNVGDIKSKTKLFNPNVEVPVSKVLQHLKECLQYNSTRGQFSFQYMGDPGDQLVIQVTSHLTGGVPFKWKFEAARMDKEVLSKEVTMPLLSMVSELILREKALVSILKRKDAEIEDMKAGGGKVSRKYLETAPFNHKAFQQERIQSKGFEETVAGQGKSCFEDDGQALYKEVKLTTAWLNRPRQEENLVGDMDTLPADNDGPGQSPARDASGKPSPAGSRDASPRKPFSPGKLEEKQTELLRREALERKLEEEKQKQQQKPKKKKKKLF